METLNQPEDDRSASAMALVKSQRTMVLATSEANDCWAAPVYYAYHDGAFYFFSSPNSRHIQQGIIANQTAAAVFADSEQWEEIHGLQMKGRVEAVEKTVEKIAAVARFITKFPFAKPFLQTGADTTASAPAVGEKVKMFRFVPQTAYYVNNRLGFGKRFAVNLN